MSLAEKNGLGASEARVWRRVDLAGEAIGK